ncbi:hypothetical protein [Microbulbifer yueqingensis]|uniref:Bacteriophage replication gene A protein (GPA) n=1 Tax=Microbulbifer yueqingensis TaxID=658219 RepID=A0A1G9EGG5_9GAMM|nr:hypothetical protein [Microbulbifer yueqingensis]SDK75163.1 hypothetical protein SAMN05216212_3112 [Microbulbifer yueqingensis]
MKDLHNGINSEKNKMRNAFKEMLTSEYNKYHLTITFREGTKDDVALGSLNFLMKCLNQRLFGRRYLHKNRFIDGFVARERCGNGTLHFHILIRDKRGDLESRFPIRIVLEELIPKLSSIGHNSKHRVKRRLIGDRGWLLQPYKNNGDSRLEEYLTKNFDSFSSEIDEKGDTIGLLGAEYVHFGC